MFVLAAIANEAAHRVPEMWFERRPFDLVVCPELLPELAELLDRSKLRMRISHDDARALAVRLTPEAEIVDDPTSANVATRDPDDGSLIAVALDQGVDAAESGDKDLLERHGSEVRVLSPAGFGGLLQAE